MKCDFDDTELPEDYVPEVDANGRPVQAVCRHCKDIQVRERSRRLGITAAEDLLDRFERHLSSVIKPSFCRFVNSPSDGWRMRDK